MAQYLVNGNRVDVLPDGERSTFAKLPAGTYVVKWLRHPENKFILETTDDFNINGVIYGDIKSRTNKIINTFLDRESNTGVLLSGIKGSGKTLQAKYISEHLLNNHNISTIIINDVFDTYELSIFLKNINEPVVIIFEEFEKLYKTLKIKKPDDIPTLGDKSPVDMQEGLLSLLDGVFLGKKLFIFTCNNTYKITDLLLNRPGRVFYHFKYHGIDDTVVKEYCNNILINKEKCKQILDICDYLDESFTFDMLKAIVEESNRYSIEPIEALEYMNIEPDVIHSYYSISLDNVKGYDLHINKNQSSKYLENYLDPNFYFTVNIIAIAHSAEEVKIFEKIDSDETDAHCLCSDSNTEQSNPEKINKSVGFSSFVEKPIKIRIFLSTKELKYKKRGILVYEKHGIKITCTRDKKYSNLWKYM